MLNIIIAIIIILLLIVAVVCIDLYISYNIHYCPYCGKLMSHAYTKKEGNTTYHVFHCPHCGAWEDVDEEDLINPHEQ